MTLSQWLTPTEALKSSSSSRASMVWRTDTRASMAWHHFPSPAAWCSPCQSYQAGVASWHCGQELAGTRAYWPAGGGAGATVAG